VIEESNNLLQQAKLDGEKLHGWRSRQLKNIVIHEASKKDVLKLFNPTSKFWCRYGCCLIKSLHLQTSSHLLLLVHTTIT